VNGRPLFDAELLDQWSSRITCHRAVLSVLILSAHLPPVAFYRSAGYLAGYADTEFIDELNTFTLPMLSGGSYRAFEIIGDSMMPTPSGSIIVGEKVEDIENVKNNAAYIVVSKSEGIVYKRVIKSNKNKNKLTLVSDNPAYQPLHGRYPGALRPGHHHRSRGHLL